MICHFCFLQDSYRELSYETIIAPDTHSEFSSSPDSSWNSSISSVFIEPSQTTQNNSVWSFETTKDYSNDGFFCRRRYDNRAMNKKVCIKI